MTLNLLKILKEKHINAKDIAMLIVLGRHGGMVDSMSKLIRIANGILCKPITSACATLRINALSDMDLVERVQHPTNHNVIKVRLTPLGRGYFDHGEVATPEQR